MVKKYTLGWFVSIFDEEFNRAISKFMIEAASICETEACRTVIDNAARTFDFDFALGDQKISDEKINAKKENLIITFYEVRMTGRNGVPKLERHDFRVVFITVDDKGESNIAVENSMYRTFAAKFIQVLSLFPDRFIKDSCYIDDEELLL